jgi:hypothetical protein
MSGAFPGVAMTEVVAEFGDFVSGVQRSGRRM